MQRLSVLFSTLFVCAAPALAQPSGEVSFYVVAHEDDWQLFFSRNACADVALPMHKAVFVYLTAGDGGEGVGPSDNPYYLAREEGAVRAVRFLADMSSAQPEAGASGTPSIRGHVISRYSYKGTVSYFLRLPDGWRDGGGWPRTGRASLRKLRTGAINQLSAVDGSTTYLGWRDLVDTLEQLVHSEVAGTGARSVWLNIPDTDASQNGNDHSDHLETGHAMDAVAGRLTCAGVARFVGHPSARRRENLTAADLANQVAVYAVTASAVSEVRCARCASQWRHHRMWFGRNYVRTTPGDGSSCLATGNNHRALHDCATARHACARGEAWDSSLCRCAE